MTDVSFGAYDLGMRLLVVMCLATVGLTSGASAAPRLPRVSACGYSLATRPDYVLLGCGDGGQYLANIHWSNWSQWYAHGTAVWWQNLCTPACASGHFRRDHVRITLSRPRICRQPSQLLFTRMTLRGGHSHATVAKIPRFGSASCP
jgi:hypothetical protein